MTVALVEDSAVVRTHIEQMLGQLPGLLLAGTADTADEALKLVDVTSPDLLILDILLREGTGFDVLRNLHHRTHRPRVIVWTNHPYSAYRRECLKLGADYFFHKSSEVRQFLNVLRAFTSPAPPTQQAPTPDM
jgi:DNA-binding NarL/FixJ family response regulator